MRTRCVPALPVWDRDYSETILMRFLYVFLFALALSRNLPAAEPNPCLQCDRKLRKTMESIQAWRRLNKGNYPSRLVDLEVSKLLPSDGGRCPDYLREGSLAGGG